MHDLDRTANLLGATALALNDLAIGGARDAIDVSASGAAALVSLSAQPGLGVTELGRRIGLTQSAAARMVDSLESDGLLERRPSAWSSRMTSVHPTRRGQRAAERILAGRSTPLAEVVATLGVDDQIALTELLTRLLPELYERLGSADRLCRMCDRDCCTAQAACPVGAAERSRSGQEEQ